MSAVLPAQRTATSPGDLLRLAATLTDRCPTPHITWTARPGQLEGQLMGGYRDRLPAMVVFAGLLDTVWDLHVGVAAYSELTFVRARGLIGGVDVQFVALVEGVPDDEELTPLRRLVDATGVAA